MALLASSISSCWFDGPDFMSSHVTKLLVLPVKVIKPSARLPNHALYCTWSVQRKVLVTELMETEDQESADFFRKIKERRER